MNHYAGPPLAHFLLDAPSSHATHNLYRARDLLTGPLTDREEQLAEALAEALDELSAAREAKEEAEEKVGEAESAAKDAAEEAEEAENRAKKAEGDLAMVANESPALVMAEALRDQIARETRRADGAMQELVATQRDLAKQRGARDELRAALDREIHKNTALEKYIQDRHGVSSVQAVETATKPKRARKS